MGQTRMTYTCCHYTANNNALQYYCIHSPLYAPMSIFEFALLSVCKCKCIGLPLQSSFLKEKVTGINIKCGFQSKIKGKQAS